MSDSMDRDKIELLTAKEREEEEEMKRELTDMGMYDSGYTYKDMKEILSFISESKVMAYINNDNKVERKESLQSSKACTSDSKTNLTQTLDMQERAELARPIYSYRTSCSSPTMYNRMSSSPESTILDMKNSVYRRKSSDSDDIFDRLHDDSMAKDGSTHNTSRYFSLKSKGSLPEGHNTRTMETKSNLVAEDNQLLDRWRINPLDFSVLENDVPLQQPERRLVQDRLSLKCFKDEQTPEKLDKTMHALNHHLNEIAELWHIWHHSTDSKFQWGSPIQVGTANSNLEKKSPTNTKHDQTKKESVSRYTHERSGKRKAATNISSYASTFSSEDEDEFDFVTVKRKKTKADIIKASRIDAQSSAKEENSSKIRAKNIDDSQNSVNSISDTKIGKSLREKVRSNVCEQKAEGAESAAVYPRRIIPPNPKRSNIAVSVKKQISTASSKTPAGNRELELEQMPTDNKTSMNEKVSKELKVNNEVQDSIQQKKDMSIKPLPLKRLSIRLERQCVLLKQAENERKQKLVSEQEQMRKREEEEKKKQKEQLKRQIDEVQEKFKRDNEAQRKRKEKSGKWNEILQIKAKESKERGRRIQEQNEARLMDVESVHQGFQESGNSVMSQAEDDKESTGNIVNCPICNKSFSRREIEMHAAKCEQYTDNERGDDNVNLFKSKANVAKKSTRESRIMFECNVCSVFKTSNGTNYEVHVNNCIEKKRQQEQPRTYDHPHIGMNNIPTSPVRCFQPISEQTNSEIDYKAQFASNSKTYSRKRKQ
ncbi:hypothetical protein KM043_009745 [Ampulex compressa]|nr:hypothetical protein KM043_009745 [Ampulex compressa]